MYKQSLANSLWATHLQSKMFYGLLRWASNDPMYSIFSSNMTSLPDQFVYAFEAEYHQVHFVAAQVTQACRQVLKVVNISIDSGSDKTKIQPLAGNIKNTLCSILHMKVNEAENQKKESWFTHQKMYKSYQEIEKTTKTMQSKLKKSVEKARWVVSDMQK